MQYKQIKITSMNNQLVKEIELINHKKGREELNSFVIEGEHLMIEALNGSSSFSYIVYQVDYPITQLLVRYPLTEKSVVLVEVSTQIMKKIAGTDSPQGVLAVMQKIPYAMTQLKIGGNFLILDRIQDPGNMGTLLRTADAAGMQGVFILQGSVDPYSAKVVRAAMGAHFHLPFFVLTKESMLEWIRKNQVPIIVAALHGEYYFKSEIGQGAIVLGNEAQGVSQEFMQIANKIVTIPIYGKAESLNVAVAGAILMYQMRCQNEKV